LSILHFSWNYTSFFESWQEKWTQFYVYSILFLKVQRNTSTFPSCLRFSL
jgi:hypothetical protein